MFLEIGMAVSESHAFKGGNILFFILGFDLGFYLFSLGLYKLRGKPKWESKGSN